MDMQSKYYLQHLWDLEVQVLGQKLNLIQHRVRAEVGTLVVLLIHPILLTNFVRGLMNYFLYHFLSEMFSSGILLYLLKLSVISISKKGI